jgi:hypothetical protein
MFGKMKIIMLDGPACTINDPGVLYGQSCLEMPSLTYFSVLHTVQLHFPFFKLGAMPLYLIQRITYKPSKYILVVFHSKPDMPQPLAAIIRGFSLYFITTICSFATKVM